MLRLTTLDYVLWVVPQICMVVVLWQMTSRRLIREFPSFAAYCGLQLLRFVVLLSIDSYGMRQHYALYFYTYWAFEVIDVCVSLAVIREMYGHFFRCYPVLQTFGGALFHWGAALLVLMSVAAAAGAHGKEFDRIIAAVLVFDQVGTTLRGGLLLLLLVIALFFKLKWDRRQFGIAIGFSIYLIVSFVVIAMRRHGGTAGNHTWSLLKDLAYACGTVAWAWTFLRKPATAESTFPFTAAQLDEWNSALSNFIR